VARRSGLSAKTLRYDETIGVVQPPVRMPNGYREYDDRVLDLIARRTAEIDDRIVALQRLRGDLTRLADRARHLDASECDATAVCQIIVPERPRPRVVSSPSRASAPRGSSG
jgi:DNA-binding transcriptional MerR regulator